MAASFYDLDYIIEVNQKRLEQYNASLQKVLERFTQIILIYSGLGIFIIALTRDILEVDIKDLFFYLAFCLFSSLFIVSLTYFIRLLLPAEIALLDPPERYYTDLMQQMEEKYPGNRDKVDNFLKTIYIDELESAISTNLEVFRRKSSFYYNALLFAFLAVIPYIVCVGFHLSKKEVDLQKIGMINRKIVIS